MSDLRKKIQELTRRFAEEVARTVAESIYASSEDFADAVIEAISQTSLGQLVGAQEPPRRSSTRPSMRPRRRGRAASSRLLPAGKKRRRDSETIEALAGDIARLCKQHADGIRAEEMRKVLKVERRELPRPIAVLLERGAITKKGQKRATLYFAA